MKLKLLLVFVLIGLASATPLSAQVDEVKGQINKIKKSTQYIYAESTASTEADARHYAEEKLYERINAWVATQKKMNKSLNLVVSNRKELWTTLSMPRGNNMFRSFIYIKKSDITPTENAVVIANNNRPAVDETLQSALPEVVKTIAACGQYSVMAEKMKELKAQGKIKNYDRYASLDNPDNYYLVIYNREGKVVAVLTPGAERRNVKTNQVDGVKNYSGCGAIGFEI